MKSPSNTTLAGTQHEWFTTRDILCYLNDEPEEIPPSFIIICEIPLSNFSEEGLSYAYSLSLRSKLVDLTCTSLYESTLLPFLVFYKLDRL